MYEIYLDESNGSIREEDDDIPSEDIVDVKIDSSGKISNDANDSDKKGDSDLDKSKSKSSPVKEETRDSKDAKDGKETKDGKDSKETRSSKDSKSSSSKDKQSHSLTSSGSNNVWVSGLSSSTRAAALQTLFKKYGKVLSAKIITNPRIPGSRAHGFITLENAEQAEKCIQNLNKTELDGKTIFVSKNRPSESSSSSSSRHKSSTSSSSKKDKPKEKDSKSKSDENKDPDKEKSKDDSKKSDDKSSHDDDKKKKEKSGDKDKEKEKDRPKDRDKEKEKTKSREKDKDKDKSKEKEKEKEKKKEDDKDQSKEKSDRDKGGEKEKSKEKDRKDDKSKDDDKKDESKDDKNKKDRPSKSTSRSRSRDRRGSQSPPRKLLRRPMGRRMGPGFMGRRMNTRGRSASSRPNPVLLRRIETERAQRRRERDREILESKRRRIALIRTQREVERKAQEERDRLEREMVKLRIERERLEREKAELIRLEREKARLERERIEREREELRRKQFQLPHRIDDSPRGRSGINKRPYDSRADPREIDIHWDDRKRMSAPSPVTPSGRTSFNGPVASRMSDFDARHGHNSTPYDNKGASYRRIKLENLSSGGGLKTEYDSRRDSGRHGTSGGGHDRDDRRSTGGSGSGYYRDSARMTGASRDRDRRGGGGGGGGRDDWKSSHDNRRDRYLDKGLSSMGTSYSAGASYSGGSGGDWGGERGSSSMSKLSYPAGPSVSESRSRGAGMGSSMMTGGGNQMADLYDNSSSMPMPGILSHGGIGTTSGLNSDERPYLHSVRRF
ncbi:SAFB-like transcription modulator [Panonychus citri]|uniref:SAFB-like transcription modulator n=1 Tax=Panonychus citri TaxID=50023 RepID=UPI00230737F6|nr:SAFB-like transcription modulator [Panonychus citri]